MWSSTWMNRITLGLIAQFIFSLECNQLGLGPEFDDLITVTWKWVWLLLVIIEGTNDDLNIRKCSVLIDISLWLLGLSWNKSLKDFCWMTSGDIFIWVSLDSKRMRLWLETSHWRGSVTDQSQVQLMNLTARIKHSSNGCVKTGPRPVDETRIDGRGRNRTLFSRLAQMFCLPSLPPSPLSSIRSELLISWNNSF